MSSVLDVIAPRLLAPAVMLALGLIVKGYADVGDGFGAGVIVALAIALRYVVQGADRAEQELPLLRRAPAIAGTGFVVSLLVGFAGVPFGYAPFTHLPPPEVDPVRIGRLELITAVVFDVGVLLLVVGAFVILIHHLSRLVAESEG